MGKSKDNIFKIILICFKHKFYEKKPMYEKVRLMQKKKRSKRETWTPKSEPIHVSFVSTVFVSSLCMNWIYFIVHRVVLLAE